MGEETVSKAIDVHKLNNMKVKESSCFKLKLIGGYSKSELYENMQMNLDETKEKYMNQMTFLYDVPTDVAERLLETYGVASLRVIKQGEKINKYEIICIFRRNNSIFGHKTKEK